LAPTVIDLAGADIPENMQGKVFLGKNKEENPYVYIARGRMDERYDMQRGVRSKQFKYLRYYEPNKPFMQFMNTPEGGPLMTEIRKAEKKGNLNDAGWQMVAKTKPTESLFDLVNDPLELNDLARDPKMKDTLQKMRAVHDRWMLDIMDVGLLPEPIMRTWETVNDQPIYNWIRSQENFYDELLMMSSTEDENILYSGLNHDNEAVRYWAGQGLYNLKTKVKPATLKQLKKTLDDTVINVSISAARALLRQGDSSKEVIKILAEGLEAENEWTRLQTALVLDDFETALKQLVPAAKKSIKQDYNKYVVRVLNRGLNKLYGTSNTVK
jgi:uncharacterized sulfatase